MALSSNHPQTPLLSLLSLLKMNSSVLRPFKLTLTVHQYFSFSSPASRSAFANSVMFASADVFGTTNLKRPSLSVVVIAILGSKYFGDGQLISSHSRACASRASSNCFFSADVFFSLYKSRISPFTSFDNSKASCLSQYCRSEEHTSELQSLRHLV